MTNKSNSHLFSGPVRRKRAGKPGKVGSVGRKWSISGSSEHQQQQQQQSSVSGPAPIIFHQRAPASGGWRVGSKKKTHAKKTPIIQGKNPPNSNSGIPVTPFRASYVSWFVTRVVSCALFLLLLPVPLLHRAVSCYGVMRGGGIFSFFFLFFFYCFFCAILFPMLSLRTIYH